MVPDTPESAVRLVTWTEPVGREVVHEVVAGALGIPSSELRIDSRAGGKPFVGRPRTDMRFSVTHAGGMCAVALGWGRDVGVDAEALDRDVEGWTLWRHVLSERELELLGRDGDRRSALLRAWARKEALLKAAGFGLAVEPATIELTAEGGILALPAALGARSAWSLHDVSLPGYVVVVACRPAARSVVVERVSVRRDDAVPARDDKSPPIRTLGA